MRVNFFEEFYTEKTLINSCKKVPFSSTIFIACSELDQFLLLKEKIVEVAPHVELGFWPILTRSYWISPFSYTFELSNLLSDLSKYKKQPSIKVLLDLELPLIKPSLLLRNMLSIVKNKRIIESILRLEDDHPIHFFSAEYPMPFRLIRWGARVMGIHYSHQIFRHTTITMQYNTTIGSISKRFFMQNTLLQVKGSPYNQISLGLISAGVFNEKNFLSPETLDADLMRLKDEGIQEVTIYSLAGNSGDYAKVINKYASI